MTQATALQGGPDAGKRPPQGGRSPQAGATLVELMFAIFIFAVLTVIAVPSFRDASLGARLTAAANSLHGSIQIARSEAIKANATTTLCASSDGTNCEDVDWDRGWIVLDANDVIIHSEPEQPAGYRVVEATGIDELSFQPIGVGASAASFVVCRDEPVGSQERIVTVTATGIAHVTTTEAGDCP